MNVFQANSKSQSTPSLQYFLSSWLYPLLKTPLYFVFINEIFCEILIVLLNHFVSFFFPSTSKRGESTIVTPQTYTSVAIGKPCFNRLPHQAALLFGNGQ